MSRQVFISYAQRDHSVAERIADALARSGVRVWFDREAIETGANWDLEIGRAIGASDAMVVVVTPGSMRSQHVRREVDHALTSERFKSRLFPVIVESGASMPWIFKHLQLVDLSKDAQRGMRDLVRLVKGARRTSKKRASTPSN